MSWNRRLMLAEAVKGGEMELDYLTIIPEGGDVTIALETWAYMEDDGSLAFAEILGSPDGGANWYDIPDSQEITIPQGNKLLLKANYYDYIMAILDKSDVYPARIVCLEGQFSVEGTPLSLAHGDDFKTRRELAPSMFWSLFDTYDTPVSGLIRINNPESFLPSTELNESCYYAMFNDCSELENAPVLPATELNDGCYCYMFYGCSSLVNAPELPATTLASLCYRGMFDGCTSLTEAPVLPATTLAYLCYAEMFRGCTSLVKAPELPATELAEYCYHYMFSNCTNLTKAPILPALTLTTQCYGVMFYKCEKLNYIEAMFTTTPSEDYTNYWVYGVSSIGTFVVNKDSNWYVLGSHGIPKNWEIQAK